MKTIITVVLSLTSSALFAANTGEVELSREGKASIQMALQFLAARQRTDGSLSGDQGQTTGIVASAALAWMCQGNLPGEGPYGKNVAKAIDFILNCAQPSGLLFKGQDQHVMYHHGFATIALAEAWGQTRDKRIHDKLKNAVELIIRTQNEKGGWRYMPKVADDDLSVTVVILLALRGAKDAGIPVPKETIDRAVSYVMRCKSDKDQAGNEGFAYQPGQGKKWSTTAAGVMSLMLCGNYKPNQLADGLKYLQNGRKNNEDKEWFIYGHYYAAQAMYQCGANEKFRELWKNWYPDIAHTLLERQKTSGAERGVFQSDRGPEIWGTSMCVLILGIPYRYLPIYQR